MIIYKGLFMYILMFFSDFGCYFGVSLEKKSLTDLFHADPDTPQLLVRQQYSFFHDFLDNFHTEIIYSTIFFFFFFLFNMKSIPLFWFFCVIMIKFRCFFHCLLLFVIFCVFYFQTFFSFSVYDIWSFILHRNPYIFYINTQQ